MEIENLEDSFQNLFRTSVSGSGEEELLRIASNFSLQLSAEQIRCICFIQNFAIRTGGEVEKALGLFVAKWLELKQNNNSDLFVMKALEFISLRKFLLEGAFKVNLNKT